MAAFMYFTLYNMIMCKPISQEKCATLFKVQYSSFRRTVLGRRQPGGTQLTREKKLKVLAKAEGTPTSLKTRSQTGLVLQNPAVAKEKVVRNEVKQNPQRQVKRG